MNSYDRVKNSGTFDDNDLLGPKRQERVLREFKEVLYDLVLMLREASGMKTVYMYWVNRARCQFVLETKSTTVAEAVFQDRIGFDDHFLDAYKNIRQPVTLQIGKDISPQVIDHYYGQIPVQHVTLLPFVNNDETVAITVVESGKESFSSENNAVISSYVNALGNVLNTYLEISDLFENQNEWTAYEEGLQFLDKNGHHAGLLADMLGVLQEHLDQGGATLIAKGMGQWTTVLNSDHAVHPPLIGTPVEERSVAKNALHFGEPEFAIHFNRNPKRISPRELHTDGATLAIPMLFDDHRKAVVMVYDANPLIFKESTKHKLTNVVRLAGLKMQATLANRRSDESLVTNSYGAFIPDLWERIIDTQIDRLNNQETSYHTWVGMVTLSELSQIRTKLRVEELNMLQEKLVQIFNPGNCGIPGLVGFYSDYIYVVVLQSNDKTAIEHWAHFLKETFSEPVEFGNNLEVDTDLSIGFQELNTCSGDSYQVISGVKKMLSGSAGIK